MGASKSKPDPNLHEITIEWSTDLFASVKFSDRNFPEKFQNRLHPLSFHSLVASINNTIEQSAKEQQSRLKRAGWIGVLCLISFFVSTIGCAVMTPLGAV